jgi:hypothetical protein
MAPGVQRALAVAAFLAVAGLFYYLTHLPVARAIDPAVQWKAARGEQVVLGPLARAGDTVLSFEGGDNEPVDLWFSDGAFDAVTLATLRRDFRLSLPARGGIAWSTRASAAGHTMIDIALQAPGIAPVLHVEPAGEGARPAVRIRAERASLAVQFLVALGDATSAAPDQMVLRIAGAPPVALPGALPLTVVVPDGASLTLRFSGARPTAFALGAPDQPAPGLAVRDAGVLRADGSYGFYACAAAAGAHFFPPRRFGGPDCAASGALRVSSLGTAADGVALALGGAGFLIKDGEAQTDAWYEKLQKNVPVAVVFGMLFAALGRWLLSAFARKPGEHAKPAVARDSGE